MACVMFLLLALRVSAGAQFRGADSAEIHREGDSASAHSAKVRKEAMELSASMYQSVTHGLEQMVGAGFVAKARKLVATRIKQESRTWWPEWERNWENLKRAQTSPDLPFWIVALVDGKVLMYSTAANAGHFNDMIHQRMLLQGYLLQAVIELYPQFPNVIFSLTYRPSGVLSNSLEEGTGFPGFAYITQDGDIDLASWPISAHIEQVCGLDVMQRGDPEFFARTVKPWDERNSTAYFGGRPSSAGRWRLDHIANTRKDIFDVRILKVQDKVRKTYHGSMTKTAYRHAMQPDLVNEGSHKYNIYADGCTCAIRGTRLLASGGALIKIEGQCAQKAGTPMEGNADVGSCGDVHRAEWLWRLGLTPGEHYVPVKPDESDLVEKVEMLRANDTLAQNIAQAGAEFYNGHCRTPHMVAYVATIMLELAREQAGFFHDNPGYVSVEGLMAQGFDVLPSWSDGYAGALSLKGSQFGTISQKRFYGQLDWFSKCMKPLRLPGIEGVTTSSSAAGWQADIDYLGMLDLNG